MNPQKNSLHFRRHIKVHNVSVPFYGGLFPKTPPILAALERCWLIWLPATRDSQRDLYIINPQGVFFPSYSHGLTTVRQLADRFIKYPSLRGISEHNTFRRVFLLRRHLSYESLAVTLPVNRLLFQDLNSAPE